MRLISSSASQLRSLAKSLRGPKSFRLRHSFYFRSFASTSGSTTSTNKPQRIRSFSQTSMMPSIEDAKRSAAKTAVANHYPRNAKYVGIGSGTTIIYVVQAIKELGVDTAATSFVPTGYQSNQLIVKNGLRPLAFDALPADAVLDVAFDGADEVDDELNCIKGGGACLYQEKLVALQAKEFVVVADYRKKQSRLITIWPSIPIEVQPLAVRRVLTKLKALGSAKPQLRISPVGKEGPVKTDQDLFIIDAPFPQLRVRADLTSNNPGSGADGMWEVEDLATTIKQITGVLEVGLFCGRTGPQARAAGAIGGQKPVAAYFGMEDGSVSSRTASSSQNVGIS